MESFGLNPDDIAKNLVAHFMEYTPDFLVPDNRDAYTICVTHAIITAHIIQDYDHSKSKWTDVLEVLKELDSRAQQNIKYTTRNTEFLKEVISKQEKEIRTLSHKLAELSRKARLPKECLGSDLCGVDGACFQQISGKGFCNEEK